MLLCPLLNSSTQSGASPFSSKWFAFLLQPSLSRTCPKIVGMHKKRRMPNKNFTTLNYKKKDPAKCRVFGNIQNSVIE
jgi:hypothetical protein